MQTESKVSNEFWIYTVKKGDNLWNLAKKYLGSGNKYQDIKAASMISSNTIVPGQKLNIPGTGLKIETVASTSCVEDFKPQFPVNYVFVTTPFSKSHPANDYGYNSAKGAASNQLIYAPVQMLVTRAEWNDTVGNLIYGTYDKDDEFDWIFRFIHLSKILVSVDDVVSSGTAIGRMGNTGSSSHGAHLHVDVWKVPKSHTFKFSSDRLKYAVDPLTVFRLSNKQSVSATTEKQYNILK